MDQPVKCTINNNLIQTKEETAGTDLYGPKNNCNIGVAFE
jgi:hypothetical protein